MLKPRDSNLTQEKQKESGRRMRTVPAKPEARLGVLPQTGRRHQSTGPTGARSAERHRVGSAYLDPPGDIEAIGQQSLNEWLVEACPTRQFDNDAHDATVPGARFDYRLGDISFADDEHLPCSVPDAVTSLHEGIVRVHRYVVTDLASHGYFPDANLIVPYWPVVG